MAQIESRSKRGLVTMQIIKSFRQVSAQSVQYVSQLRGTRGLTASSRWGFSKGRDCEWTVGQGFRITIGVRARRFFDR
jgi:hypothetical protein